MSKKPEEIQKTEVIEIPDPVVLEPGKRYRWHGKIYRAECAGERGCGLCAGYGDLCGAADCEVNNTILIEEE